MPERGRLVRPALPIEEAYCKEANPFGHGLEVGGRAARVPARTTFLCLLKFDILSQRTGRPSPWLDAHIALGALLDAADETRTIIAAAAFRALADISAFDPYIDGKRLDAILVSCVGDAAASIAARVMAAQLCGERGMASSRIALERLSDNPDTPESLQRSAKWALEQLANTNR